jgi:hypothetical protein
MPAAGNSKFAGHASSVTGAARQGKAVTLMNVEN